MSSLRKTDTIQRPRFLAQLLGVFAALALPLAAVGTYGMFSYIVAERRGEIGIRMALGAQRLGVLAHIMKEGLVLAGIAVAVSRPHTSSAGSLRRCCSVFALYMFPLPLVWLEH
jgi:ABC-type antimicrobial peptide transport system permease subunit